MNDKRKKTWLVLGLWSVVLIIFLGLFFIASKPSEWSANSNIKFISGIVFGVGYILFFVIQLKGKNNTKNEKDKLIQYKSTSLTLVIILMYVFIFTMLIYIVYENDVLMPISWMWFLGYSTVFLTYIVNSGFYLWYEKRIK
ncbi:MAG: hypothetical protein B6I17_02010 [Tenericutes bacterium 4572_104]|nr:MAG: hypothetical protein B6I17_02010 [Tenericutes bacterium 4572_104]